MSLRSSSAAQCGTAESYAVSDYLYGLDIPFDVDADGDMMIDDILISLSEEEDFEQSFTVGKTTYLVQGKKED